MGRQLLFVLVSAAIAPACTTILGNPELAQWEHDLAYQIDSHPIELEVGSSGHFATGEVDSTRHPQLAKAWDQGAAPASPLIGREPAYWLRALDITRQEDHSHIYVKALAPYPVRLSLLVKESDQWVLLGQLDSTPWSTGIHFASLQVDYPAQTGTQLTIRVEGAHQANESLLRLRFVDTP